MTIHANQNSGFPLEQTANIPVESQIQCLRSDSTTTEPDDKIPAPHKIDKQQLLHLLREPAKADGTCLWDLQSAKLEYLEKLNQLLDSQLIDQHKEKTLSSLSLAVGFSS